VDAFCSLTGINERIDKILYEYRVTQSLTIFQQESNDVICPPYENLIDKFCFRILPKIGRNIKWLHLEFLSVDRILVAAFYSNLYGLGLYNINMNTAASLFFARSSSLHMFKHQITSLIIHLDKDYSPFERRALVNESKILYELKEDDFNFIVETDANDTVARNETIDLDSILPKIVGHARIENFFGIPGDFSKKKKDLYKITRLPLFVDERKAVYTANFPRFLSLGEDGSSSGWFDYKERKCTADEKSRYTFCTIAVPVFSSIQHPCLRSIVLNNSTKDCLKETVDLSSPHIVKTMILGYNKSSGEGILIPYKNIKNFSRLPFLFPVVEFPGDGVDFGSVEVVPVVVFDVDIDFCAPVDVVIVLVAD
ncbi:unnamed protein product, partial [Rotaria sp. Silwood1]